MARPSFGSTRTLSASTRNLSASIQNIKQLRANRTFGQKLKGAIKHVFKPSKRPDPNSKLPDNLKGMTTSQYWQMKNLKKKWWFPRSATRSNIMAAGTTQLGSLANTGALMLALKLKGNPEREHTSSSHTPKPVGFTSGQPIAPGLMSVPNYG